MIAQRTAADIRADREARDARDAEVQRRQDEADATLRINAFDLYVGAGNWITYEDRGTSTRKLVYDQTLSSVEVGEIDFSSDELERQFKWIPKTAITAINGQKVKVIP